MSKANLKQNSQARTEDTINLCFWVSWRRRLLELSAAALSGVLLGFAFPPLELAGLVWVAFIPLLLLPVPHPIRRRLVIGYVFGLAHFLVSLWWLNEVGFGAGILLALVCAVFPMLWYLLLAAFNNFIKARRRTIHKIDPPRSFLQNTSAQVSGGGLILAASWCALEWIRSWIFTGFSWNQIGISQWRHQIMLQLSTVTGVYGLSFIIVFTNFALGWILLTKAAQFKKDGRSFRGLPWPPATAIILFIPVLVLWATRQPLPAPDRYLRVAGIQGNLSQRREWKPEQLEEAIEVYEHLTAQSVKAADGMLDLIVWPETAIPAPVEWNQQAADMLRRVADNAQTQMLIGSLAYRIVEGKDKNEEPSYAMTNSALLLDPDGNIKDYYDKVHLVPFGEFVPFAEQLPWLVDLIGMGRGLLAGTEFTIFNLPQGARAGVNICYEDAFPRISREFVRRGANLLFTLTNDAWYAESAGPRQHMIHAVFRAVENQRPLFRSGNNSDTCLIWPSGKIEGMLYDPVTGSPFVRGYRIYNVPIWDELPTTFYTRYGDWFAILCTLIALGNIIILAAVKVREKHGLAEKIRNSQGI